MPRCVSTALGVAWGILGMCGSVAAQSGAVEPSLFRIFLKDGTALASYGEFAHVGEQVIFTLPMGSARQHLASIGASEVDWPRTYRYTYAVRAAHYAATRGEAEFSAMSARVAGVLTEIARTPDPRDQLRLAEGARRELADWPVNHFGYKANEIRETLGVLDEVIAGLRAKTSSGRFDLSLVAGGVAPPTVPLLEAPTLQDSIAQALRLSADAAPAERVQLLRDATATLDEAASSATGDTAAWVRSTRRRLDGMIEAETEIDRDYAKLRTSALADAESKARRADVRGLTKLRARVVARDARLGGQRPQEVQALLATLDQRLNAAQRLRLALDQWAVKEDLYRDYRRTISSPLELLADAAPALNDIRALAGPSADTLANLGRRLDKLQRSLRRITAPADLYGTHASLVSACQLADAAVRQRQRAIAGNDMDLARNASAAAAGALMLAERVSTEIAKLLEAPKLQ